MDELWERIDVIASGNIGALGVEEVAADLAEGLARIQRAVRTQAVWLVQAQTGFNSHDMQGIHAILDGKKGDDVT